MENIFYVIYTQLSCLYDSIIDNWKAYENTTVCEWTYLIFSQ